MASAAVMALLLAGCGQKGALVIPHTPEAAQRSTLPQTVFGTTPKAPATPASGAAAAVPPPPLPNLPDIQ
ncbi:MAG TPA: lipoprotein [Rhodanobacteraceae bacterium]|nr:lipoprotein [Rhodanobacteraceae bacterium]